MWPRFHTQDSCKLLIQREQSIRNSEVSIGQLVTVIIPALHRPDLTRRCIESLQSQTLASGSMGLVVVENDARAETVLPEPLPENVRRMDLAENLGTTGSVNRALAETRSKYVLLLNNDVELEPRFLQILLSAMEQDARCGFATGKILDATDRTRIDGAGDALLLAGGAFRLGHGDPDLGQFDSPCDVLAGCGAATLFRRSALSQAGGLDEDFFAYLDDVDLCLRLQLLGYRGVYIPAAVAYHIGSATLGDVLHPRIVEWLTRNQILLVAKNYPVAALIRLLPQIAVFQVLWLGSAIRRHRLVAYGKGISGVFRLLPHLISKRKMVMNCRRVSSRMLISLLRNSEQQIRYWQDSLASNQRSSLLKIYFTLFGKSGADRNATRT